MKKANAADFRDSSREGASEVTEIGGEPLFCETCDRTCERFVDAALRDARDVEQAVLAGQKLDESAEGLDKRSKWLYILQG